MKNSKSLKVLVYGATGTQASPVVTELLRKGHHPIALTHTPQKAQFLKEAGAQLAVAHLADAAKLEQISQGVDAISLLIPFFLPNPVDGITYAKNAINAAVKAGVKLLVWNASGVIPEKPTGNPSIDIRIDIASYLKNSGLPFIIFQPSIYAENLLGPWTAPFVQTQDKLAYPLPAEVGIGWIPAQDIAALIVEALERPHLAGSSFLVSGQSKLTGVELAQEFESGLHRKITYYAMPPKEFGEILDTTFGQGAGQQAASEYQRMWDSGQFPLTHFDMEPVLAQLPVSLTSIKDWVKHYEHVFKTESIG